MRDKRSVDELSIEELERILAIRKRQNRIKRYRRYQDNGRTVASVPLPEKEVVAPENAERAIQAYQHEAAAQVQSPEYPQSYDVTADVPRFEDDEADYAEVRFVEERPTPPSHVRANGEMIINGPPERYKKYLNLLLIVVEIAAVIGLGFVLYLAFNGLETIESNEEKTSLNAQQSEQELEQVRVAIQQTLAPRPELAVTDFVLPGGHVYSEDGRHEFNYAEVPASVRPDLQEQLSEPRRTAELPADRPNDPIQVNIPKLGKNLSVFKGDDWETLRQGVGHHIGSGTPGSQYNMVLTGHNDIYGEPFRYIYQLEEGDTVEVLARNGQWYTYQVKDSKQVEPTALEVLDPRLGAVVTLITCYPYQQNTHRWVVHAELVQ